MFLTPEIITLTIVNTLLFLFATIAFFNAVKIVRFYDRDATSEYQYDLEKKSYLSATIIKFIFYLKIPLFIFFVYTLDDLSNILPGAMCAAGVVNATVYGTPLLFLKIINLYIFALWIVLNAEDMQYESQPYVKEKFLLYVFAYALLVAEIIMQTTMFASMDVNSVVDCCGKIFSTTAQTYLAMILGAPKELLLGLFYGLYILILAAFVLKNRYIYALANLFFVAFSLITLIAFFGTYIYEQPSHHCPFCLLQRDYNYIGYLLYIVLFLGTFFGIVNGVIGFAEDKKRIFFKRSLVFNTLYILLVSYFPLAYYLKNGVWL
jgi:hypothetical protein